MTERFKPHLTVALIIEHNERFLMVEEYQENHELCFGTIAGHVEAKETILNAALREAEEECGAKVALEYLVGIYEYVKDYETILRFTFKAKLQDATQAEHLASHDPDGDIVAVKWYSKDEIYAQKDKWRTRLIGLNFDDYFADKKYPLELINTLNTVNE